MKPMFFGFLFLGAILQADLHHVTVEMDLYCPPSDELQSLMDALPKESSTHNSDYEVWASSVLAQLTALSQLIQSGNVVGENVMGIRIHSEAEELPIVE